MATSTPQLLALLEELPDLDAVQVGDDRGSEGSHALRARVQEALEAERLPYARSIVYRSPPASCSRCGEQIPRVDLQLVHPGRPRRPLALLRPPDRLTVSLLALHGARRHGADLPAEVTQLLLELTEPSGAERVRRSRQRVSELSSPTAGTSPPPRRRPR